METKGKKFLKNLLGKGILIFLLLSFNQLFAEPIGLSFETDRIKKMERRIKKTIEIDGYQSVSTKRWVKFFHALRSRNYYLKDKKSLSKREKYFFKEEKEYLQSAIWLAQMYPALKQNNKEARVLTKKMIEALKQVYHDEKKLFSLDKKRLEEIFNPNLDRMMQDLISFNYEIIRLKASWKNSGSEDLPLEEVNNYLRQVMSLEYRFKKRFRLELYLLQRFEDFRFNKRNEVAILRSYRSLETILYRLMNIRRPIRQFFKKFTGMENLLGQEPLKDYYGLGKNNLLLVFDGEDQGRLINEMDDAIKKIIKNNGVRAVTYNRWVDFFVKLKKVNEHLSPLDNDFLSDRKLEMKNYYSKKEKEYIQSGVWAAQKYFPLAKNDEYAKVLTEPLLRALVEVYSDVEGLSFQKGEIKNMFNPDISESLKKLKNFNERIEDLKLNWKKDKKTLSFKQSSKYLEEIRKIEFEFSVKNFRTRLYVRHRLEYSDDFRFNKDNKDAITRLDQNMLETLKKIDNFEGLILYKYKKMKRKEKRKRNKKIG